MSKDDVDAAIKHYGVLGAKKNCECGLPDHQDQVTKFPTNSIVRFQAMNSALAGKTGRVVAHCGDGRAVIAIDDDFSETHTFHFPPFTLVDATVDADALHTIIAAQSAEIERLTTENEALQANKAARTEKWTDDRIKSALDECEQFADVTVASLKATSSCQMGTRFFGRWRYD